MNTTIHTSRFHLLANASACPVWMDLPFSSNFTLMNFWCLRWDPSRTCRRMLGSVCYLLKARRSQNWLVRRQGCVNTTLLGGTRHTIVFVHNRVFKSTTSVIGVKVEQFVLQTRCGNQDSDITLKQATPVQMCCYATRWNTDKNTSLD